MGGFTLFPIHFYFPYFLFSKCILLLQSEENNKYYFKQEEIKSR